MDISLKWALILASSPDRERSPEYPTGFRLALKTPLSIINIHKEGGIEPVKMACKHTYNDVTCMKKDTTPFLHTRPNENHTMTFFKAFCKFLTAFETLWVSLGEFPLIMKMVHA